MTIELLADAIEEAPPVLNHLELTARRIHDQQPGQRGGRRAAA